MSTYYENRTKITSSLGSREGWEKEGECPSRQLHLYKDRFC
jgi:hypothetical protein